MSGLGRRSHYRKHLTNSILNDFPEPTPPNERIAKVVGTRGSNQFEVVLSPEQQEENTGGNIENGNWDRTPQLALLPSKFRKLVWVKRNDYVICSCAVEDEDKDECVEVDGNERDSDDDDDGDGVSGKELTVSESEPQRTVALKTIPKTSHPSSVPGGIRYMITHILYKDQVKHLKDVRKWPTDPFFDDNGLAVDTDESGRKKEEEDAICLHSKAMEILNEQDKRRKMRGVTGAGNDRTDGDNEEDRGEVKHNDHLKISQSDAQSKHDEEYNEDYIYEDDLFINTNRIAKMTIDDSSSDESD